MFPPFDLSFPPLQSSGYKMTEIEDTKLKRRGNS